MLKRKQIKSEEVISTDPFGAYTGVPLESGERPVQDADDL